MHCLEKCINLYDMITLTWPTYVPWLNSSLWSIQCMTWPSSSSVRNHLATLSLVGLDNVMIEPWPLPLPLPSLPVKSPPARDFGFVSWRINHDWKVRWIFLWRVENPFTGWVDVDADRRQEQSDNNWPENSSVIKITLTEMGIDERRVLVIFKLLVSTDPPWR